MRGASLLGFAAAVFLTRWPEWLAFGRITPALQIVGDLIVFSLYMANLLVLWIATYPIERTIHRDASDSPLEECAAEDAGWRFWSYLDFHLRHHVAVIAAPLALILFTANMTRGYETQLREWSGWGWTPDTVLGLVAAAVFVVAPVMLRRIWRTAPLESGPVRDRLEALCDRIGLRCREILVWHSDGIMINAAVMGVVGTFRYVLLSDALLATMSARQVEAVFGHEAGHVRYRHIQHFLVFALVGWLAVAGVMELVARLFVDQDSPADMSLLVVEGIGFAVAAIVWGVGFGWVSRRFEGQADLFGARCATPQEEDCGLPCSVHPAPPWTGGVPDKEGRVCATGAAVFASALDRVAVLNGIPHEERSWRHSSIGSRIRSLTSLAGDPSRVKSFEQVIRRVKIAMIAVAIVGSGLSAYYWMVVAEPAILRLQAGGP